MSLDTPTEMPTPTTQEHPRDGWTYVAGLQLFSPDGRLFGPQQSWIAGSFATLADAKKYAMQYVDEITPK